jgi:glyoxylase-like metal-dependent hydrolase (beta-lactamase superfamily II)
MTLHWGGAQIVLEHCPGSAAGSIWVEIPSARVIFVGDTVTPHQPPFLAQADLPLWMDTLDKLLTYRDYAIVSGRGGLVSPDAVRQQQKYLKTIHKSLERLAKRNAVPEATENLVTSLLSEVEFPNKYKEQYTQRLRSGLYQYYTRYYRQENPIEQLDFQESEN